MRNNLVSPLGLVAAFVAGALALTPFVTRAEPVKAADTGGGQIAFMESASNTFVVTNGRGVYLYKIHGQLKGKEFIQKLVPLDYKMLP